MLEFLIYRMGGVAGVTRRIVYRRQGLFTMNDVRSELATRYPRLVPATNQFEGVIEQMEKRGQIVCVFSDANAKAVAGCRQLVANANTVASRRSGPPSRWPAAKPPTTKMPTAARL